MEASPVIVLALGYLIGVCIVCVIAAFYVYWGYTEEALNDNLDC